MSLSASLLLMLSCASEDYVRLYHTEEIAPSLTWAQIESMDFMGPTLIDGGVNFAVYSESAERIELMLFEDPESELPTRQIPLTRASETSALWNVFVEGVGVGQHYGYIAWGPNWTYDPAFVPNSFIGFKADVDEQGNRFNPNKLLFDPWSKAIHRDHDWGKGTTSTGPFGWQNTYAAGSKSVIVESDYEWSAEEAAWRAARESGDHPGHNWEDLILYEVHLKGMTANFASGVKYPGTFRGLGEMAGYLQDLGITAVELLPIHEKPLDGGYWGYNNLNFFAPENAYSAEYRSTGRPQEVIDEFKWMVDELHKHDVEVIIDVVYNHTGEGGLWREKLYFESNNSDYTVNFDPKEIAGLYSFRGLDNQAWYMLAGDNQYYCGNTGVGNQTRPNHTPMRRLTMDSLHYYVEELHVDGFRFDLAGILGEPEGCTNRSPSQDEIREMVIQEIADDPILQRYNTRIIAEPWTAGGSGPGIGGFPKSTNNDAVGWGEWNPYFRDWWRSFVNQSDGYWGLNSPATGGVDGGTVLTGTEPVYGWNDRKPYHSVNFVTAHDGFTMYDLVSYTEKQNGCGVLNQICCDDPTSAWCDENSGESHNRSANWGEEHLKRQMMRNFFVAMMIAHGSPMILGGDEWMRTQYGNNNAYSDWADNEWNWHRWNEWQSSYNWDRYRMHDFVRDVIRFRKERSYAFAPTEYGGGMAFAWKNDQNADMSGDDWSSRHMAIHYYGAGEGWKQMMILINMEEYDVSFSLPSGVSWARLIDTQAYFDMPGSYGDDETGYFDDYPDEDPYQSANIWLDAPQAVSGGSYTVPKWTIVVLEEQ